jgi:hypothetical protein
LNVHDIVAKIQPAVEKVVENKKDEIVAAAPVMFRWALKASWNFFAKTLVPLVVKLSVHVAVAYVVPWIIGLLQVLVASTNAAGAPNANKLMLDLVDASKAAPEDLDPDVVAVLRSMGVNVNAAESEPSIDGMAYWKE